jgi:pyruvate dehydrogenase E2 component (dihydrolipoamide acetyltransferase)
MATKVYMEALSPTMEEGRLITWLKGEGEEVNEGDVLAEVETDKATMELVARGSGVLRKRLIGEGDTQAVGSLIAVIAGADEDIAALVGGGAEAEQGPASGARPAEAEQVDRAGGGKDADVATAAAALAGSEQTETDSAERGTRDAVPGERPTPVPGDKVRAADGGGSRSIEQVGEEAGGGPNGARVKASPLARRLAAESGLALDDLRGSGPGGRIVKRDIEAALEAGPAPAPAAEEEREQERPAAAAAPAAAPAAAEYREVPLSQMRKTIAKRLTQSIGPVPHFFLTIEVDASGMMALRKRINERFADEGVKVSPNDLIIKAVAMALTRHPWVNAAWTGEAVRLYRDVHIGVAVAVEEGLITPVVRDAHRKGVTEIAQEVKELAGRARDKKLKPEEYTGSTFSISNLGMFGIEEFIAVINPPEAAILAVGGISDKVVVVDGEMVVRPRLRVTLSCDHRVVDGATGAEFLQTLKRYLEDPMMMIA